MLRSLQIKNFAVIEELRLEFGPSLNVFTGQTGAGKSILIEALGFLLGGRGSQDWLRSGAERLEITGVFDAQDVDEDLRSQYKAQEPAVTLRRELDASGKTRSYFHSQSVAASVLAALGEGLVDFHGQHEHQTLLKSAVQLDLLDGHGGLWPLRGRLRQAHRRWASLEAERKALELSDEERARRLDLYGFQVAEISEVEPRPGEEEGLEASLPRLKNAERLRALAVQAHELLYDQEGSAQELLLKSERLLEELARIDPALAPEQQALAEARARVQDAAARLSGYASEGDSGPEKLDAILSRLDRIHKLKKKYGPTVADILATRDRLKTELGWLEDSAGRTGELDKAIAQARAELEALSAEAHAARMKAAAELGRAVAKELQGLGLPSARFSVSVESEEGEPGPQGSDQVEFLIAPNPGEPLKPLKSVASGGELSRVMLGLKTVFAQSDRVRVLVFDEVDTGVGGEVGLAVGRRLAELGRARQVLCVTHLPQVACWASRHFHVSKAVSGERTFARVETLEGERLLEAVARMMGGREATAASRKHARELLESCK